MNKLLEEDLVLLEKEIKDGNKYYTMKQLWSRISNKLTIERYNAAMNFFIKGNRIIIDKRQIVWIWDPEGIKKILKTGVKIR